MFAPPCSSNRHRLSAVRRCHTFRATSIYCKVTFAQNRPREPGSEDEREGKGVTANGRHQGKQRGCQIIGPPAASGSRRRRRAWHAYGGQRRRQPHFGQLSRFSQHPNHPRHGVSIPRRIRIGPSRTFTRERANRKLRLPGASSTANARIRRPMRSGFSARPGTALPPGTTRPTRGVLKPTAFSPRPMKIVRVFIKAFSHF